MHLEFLQLHFLDGPGNLSDNSSSLIIFFLIYYIILYYYCFSHCSELFPEKSGYLLFGLGPSLGELLYKAYSVNC